MFSILRNKIIYPFTDMASAKEGDSRAADVIKNWIRSRYTIEFLGTWEIIHNPNFKVVEFDHFRKKCRIAIFCIKCFRMDRAD